MVSSCSASGIGESTDTLFRRFLSNLPICHDFRRCLRSGGDIGGLPPPPPPLSSPPLPQSSAVSCRMARSPFHFFFGESSSMLLLVHESAVADDMYRSSIFRYEPTAEVVNAQERAFERLTANSAILTARGQVG